MKRNRVALVFVAVAVAAGSIWFGFREQGCKQRGAAFAQQVERIQRDAIKELKVGSNKAAVARFFAEHNIPFAFRESEAFGALRTSGCAPLGCGTDVGFIGVKVELNAAHTVTDVPRVYGMYQDCF